MAEKSGAKIFRMRVPDGDIQVLEWLAAQEHASISLRLLIKEDIARQGGTVDVLDREIFSDGSAGKKKHRERTVSVRETAQAVPSDSVKPETPVRGAVSAAKEKPAVREEPAEKRKDVSGKTDGGNAGDIKSLLSGPGRGIPSAASMGLFGDDE